MRAALIAAVLVAGTALLVGEAAMQPTAEERFTLYALIAAGALVAGCLCWWSTRTHRRSASLRWAILVVALTAVGLTAAVVGVSAATAFLALPDVRFVLGALTFGAGSGVLVTFGVTGPLTPDLRQVAQAAQHVADGDLSEVADGALDAVTPVAARRDGTCRCSCARRPPSPREVTRRPCIASCATCWTTRSDTVLPTAPSR